MKRKIASRLNEGFYPILKNISVTLISSFYFVKSAPIAKKKKKSIDTLAFSSELAVINTWGVC